MSKTITSVSHSLYQLSTTSNPLTITSTGGIEPTSGTGIVGGSSGGLAWTVFNAGTVASGDQSFAIGIDLEAAGFVSNSGTISGEQYGVHINGIGTVINNGTISAATGPAIEISGGAGSVVVSGTVSGGAQGDAILFNGTNADHLVLTPSAVISGLVSDTAGTGTLELAAGEGPGGIVGTLANFGTQFVGFATLTVDAGADWVINATDSIDADTNPLLLTDAGTLANSGSLLVEVTLTGLASLNNTGAIQSGNAEAAVFETNGSGQVGTVTNSGTLQGSKVGVDLNGGGFVGNAAGGVIRGGQMGVVDDVPGGGGSATVVNAGLIAGEEGILGVRIGAASDSLINSGTISGLEEAVQIVYGGRVQNTGLIGGYVGRFSGGSYVYGAAPGAIGISVASGGATIVNAGTIRGSVDAIVFAGSVANRLIDDPGAVFDGIVVGGTGAASSNVLELAAGRSTLSGFGTSFTNFNTLQFDTGSDWLAATPLSLAGTTDQAVVLQPGATLSVTVLANAATTDLELAPGAGVGTLSYFGTEFQGFQTLTVDSGADWLINATDSIDADTNPLLLSDGGTLTNSGSLLVEVTLTGLASLNNTGAIQSGNAEAAVIELFGSGQVGTVTNSGTLEGSKVGVDLHDGGFVGNAAGGVIRGGQMGVVNYVPGGGGSATVVNAGLIAGEEGMLGVRLGAASDSLINSGTISGLEEAVQLYGGRVQNTGLIGGYVGRFSGGSYVYGAAPGAIGISVASGGATIVNAGTIRGSVDAIVFAGSVANRLIDDPGAVFDGQVLGGTGPGSSNVLELAAGSGTLAASDNQFVGFGTVMVDAGATWAVSGTDLFAGAQVLDRGNLTNSGSISGFVAAYIDSVVVNQGSIGGVALSGATLVNQIGSGIGSAGAAVTGSGFASTISNAGSIAGTGLGVELLAGGVVTNLSSGLISGGGSAGVYITGGSGNIITAGTIIGATDAVQFQGSNTDRLIIDPGAVFSGTLQGGSGSNTIELAATAGETGTLDSFGPGIVGFDDVEEDSGAAWQIGGSFSTAETITLQGSADMLIAHGVSNLDALIGNFGTTDTIDMRNVVANQASLVGSTVELLENGTSVGSLLLATSSPGERFTATTDHAGGTDVQVACFARGTHIRTPGGDVAIEDLRIGDRVLTHAGRSRPIRWIGRRRYAGRFAARNPDILPVLIRAGALADNVPQRDLFVSPQHAMFIDGLLIPALDIMNGASIVKCRSVETIEYIHLELETHDVILAEGAPSESFVDDDSRNMFQNAAEYALLYPADLRVPALYCAPRMSEGYALEAIRQRIDARAGIRPAAASRGPSQAVPVSAASPGNSSSTYQTGSRMHAFRRAGFNPPMLSLQHAAAPAHWSNL